MSESLHDRVISPISHEELQRRWLLTRKAMAERNIDILVIQNSNQFAGGYVRWFTGTPTSHGTATTVVFPRDEEMTLITPGAFGIDVEVKAGGLLQRGVKRWITSPTFMAAHFTTAYDEDNLDKALTGFGNATIGLVQTGSMGYAQINRLKTGRARNASFVDATELVDEQMVIKSDEEMAAIRVSAALQDKALEAAFSAIKPGMRDYEVSAVAESVARKGGSEYGLLMAASAPIGKPVMFQHIHAQNRVIQAGDYFTILIETAGPGGYFTELGRTCVIGKAPQEMKDELAFAIEAQNKTVSMMRPGAACAEIWSAYNQFMRESGRPEEKRLHSHGQGYNLVERPLIRADDPMRIRSGMNMAVHPMYFGKTAMTWICDNFRVSDDGAERLHATPQRIFEIC